MKSGEERFEIYMLSYFITLISTLILGPSIYLIFGNKVAAISVLILGMLIIIGIGFYAFVIDPIKVNRYLKKQEEKE